MSDTLGKLVISARQRLASSTSFEEFIRNYQGPSDFHQEVSSIKHPAALLLDNYRLNGVPLETPSEPWSLKQKREALLRGAHKSLYEYQEFVRGEFVDFINKKFWVVLPAQDIIHLKELRLSPLGVVPQNERRPRLICDYTYFDVNADITSSAHPEAMQFGHALRRVLGKLARANPRYGPVRMAKFDLSDGYYRIQLDCNAVAPLGVILPKAENEAPLIALPLTLPMGRTESPAYFCAATETIADLSNAKISSGEPQAPHPLEEKAEESKRRDEDLPTTFKASLALRQYDDLPR